MSDDELLDMRICDLKLSIRDTPLEARVDQLNGELSERGLRFRPHFWLSDDWFSPDGIPGIAIPFYLAHPRLCRLERKQLLEVEGGTKQWCMKILRHEAGHAIDTAFQIRRKSRYRQLFGKPSDPYPEFYKPNPQTRDYVLHLDMWYAQAHPLEDFAETFAVWLPTKSRWKARYRNWPALKKLEYVDKFMSGIVGKPPVVQSKRTIDPVSQIRRTLRTHYRRKREYYEMDYPNVYDKDLRKLFSCDRAHRRNPTAAALLSRWRGEIRRVVADWTGAYSYMVDQVLQEMIERCRELELRLGTSAEVCKRDAMILVALRTSNYLNSGHRRVMM
ncbi:putative zinc-binding metallopeptidase [Roseiconus lacunae]|uniref:Zinc-binding metallopeptidase n=1 Tax=Roseiconus lacunae TaxID=2605694 RepID=A0ABT7PCC5_9BACT|nr:putative zinc-binding metallopeptidase [Roseiconus lacunae]MCD0463134.1 putative zinc-binding metallopeptidase [Roseiconus lacunae]MDM4014106.1 putative zinc-binding metallopeptidase [Roseiconus lacunae]WRQ53406.1 putative zinc-binding metallopeptidase [Stieleria sp. HD01]